MVKFSVVVPVYNEEGNILPLFKRLSAVLNGHSWELIFVNDFSKDNTLGLIKDLAKKHKFVKYLSFSRNFGHQAALTAGMDYASGEAIITMDADLQDPPELLPEMILKWKAGADIVYARRKNFRGDNVFKSLFSKIYYYLLSQFGHSDIPRNVGDFRLIDQNVLREIKNMGESSRYLRGMVAWTGFTSDFVDYTRKDREKGVSGYTFRKLFQLGLNGFFNFSTAPLKLGFLIGLGSIIIGFSALLYMVWEILYLGVAYEFFKFLIVVLLMFNGLVFMFLWIIGEYLSRIYDDVRKRPLYIVKEKSFK